MIFIYMVTQTNKQKIKSVTYSVCSDTVLSKVPGSIVERLLDCSSLPEYM